MDSSHADALNLGIINSAWSIPERGPSAQPVRVCELCQVQSEIEGQLLADLLDSAGIPSIFRRDQIPGYSNLLTAYHGHFGALLVREQDLADAQATLEEMQRVDEDD